MEVLCWISPVLLDEVGASLPDQDGGGHGVASGDLRHDGGVHDAHTAYAP